MQNLEVRIDNVEDDIKVINMDLREIKKDIQEQDNKFEKRLDEKFKEFEAKLDKSEVSQNIRTEKTLDALASIKDSLHSQEITNLNLKNSINAMERDRKDEKQERNKLKWGVYGMGFTLGGTLIWSFIRIQFGI